jgi:hypothetical protein
MRKIGMELRLLLRDRFSWGFLAAFGLLNWAIIQITLPPAGAGWELEELLPDLLGISDALLYNKLLPAVLAESGFLCFWLVLTGLERERVAGTAPITYTTKTGRSMAGNRILTGLAASTFIFLILSGLSVGCFFALHPARNVYLQAHSAQSPSFAAHIAACLLLCWGILLSFGLLTGAAGLLFRSAFPGFLLVAALLAVWLFTVRLCRPEPALWQWPLIWNPANVLLAVEDEKLMLRISRWFLGSDPACPLVGLEPELVGSWILFGAGLFFAAWRGFLKKEM